jgi:hypothetical protein
MQVFVSYSYFFPMLHAKLNNIVWTNLKNIFSSNIFQSWTFLRKCVHMLSSAKVWG